MKKIILIMITFFFSAALFGETLRVASWNMLHLGYKGKDIPACAVIITNFDIVGMIEVMKPAGASNLYQAVYTLDTNYKLLVATNAVGENGYYEYYAYIYRKAKAGNDIGYYKGTNAFARPPYGAEFKYKNKKFSLVLCHIVFGKDKQNRKNEIYNLTDVAAYFKKYDKNVFIAGDFNLNASDAAFDPLKAGGFKPLVNPGFKTTIGVKGFVSGYDNIFVYMQTNIFGMSDFTVSGNIFDYTAGRTDFNTMKKTISDHIPVFADINF